MTSPSSPAFGADDDDVVVLVDPRDNVVGVAPKLDVHRQGQLHRAVSVVLFDDRGHLLLQQRAATKYHSGGLWSNTCCGHPRPGESVRDAANRRLRDELGITGCELVTACEFTYRADLGDGFVEHELDHVVIGRWRGEVVPNPAEVADTRWVERGRLLQSLAKTPRLYSAWTLDVVVWACWHMWRLDPEGPPTDHGGGAFRVDRARYTG